MKSVVTLLLTVFFFHAVAQEWAKVDQKATKEGAYRVGDNISSVQLGNMINYGKNTYRVSDHRVKLTILDFWATNCGPCIKFWPTALRFKKQFGDDLEIITVNSYENSKKVKDFIARRSRIDGFEMTLPVSCNDSTLWRKFPGVSLPRYVWIDERGVIGAITGGNEMTYDNLKRWIENGPFKMKNLDEKKYYPIVPHKPIFVDGNGGEKPAEVFIWSSSLTKGQEDNTANPFIFYDSLTGYGISVTNTPIVYLYGHAYNYRLREFDFFDYLPISRIELIAKDTMKYYGDGTVSGGAYNYQLLSGKPRSREQLMNMMQEDLNRYFGLKVSWEKRRKKCIVLTMFDSTLATKRPSLGGEAKMRENKIVLDSATIKDVTTVMEMSTWNYRSWKYPIIDETHFNGRITGLREDGNGENPVILDKILTKYGMRLKFEMREIDVLVLREPD